MVSKQTRTMNGKQTGNPVKPIASGPGSTSPDGRLARLVDDDIAKNGALVINPY